jgi:hypothetical protein
LRSGKVFVFFPNKRLEFCCSKAKMTDTNQVENWLAGFAGRYTDGFENAADSYLNSIESVQALSVFAAYLKCLLDHKCSGHGHPRFVGVLCQTNGNLGLLMSAGRLLGPPAQVTQRRRRENWLTSFLCLLTSS